ncbi:MAG: integral rane sensor signal transduction histidine kinase [Acidobacteria bacterium]|nr:integral rane sensor signal transduction histidine kinase [Acidobacteriota bacterium]
MIQTSIRARLISSFTAAILVPSLISAAVGVWMIDRQITSQAQSHVNADLQGANEICRNYLERLENAIRIHATRMIIYGALGRKDRGPLEPEMHNILQAERLDILTVTDADGTVFHRTRNPSLYGDRLAEDELIHRALRYKIPVSDIAILPQAELAKESAELASQAHMEITPTPMASRSGKTRETSGMMFRAAAPVLSPDGRLQGVLYGAVLINRNYEIVDKIRKVVFREVLYKGREVGTVTIFQDDVRIATNVLNADGTRAITTRASAEVADEVLRRGHTWRGRAFVVNDWYIAAYTPMKDIKDRTIGMLYVGTLERPYTDSLWRSLFIFLGMTVLGVAIVTWVAIVLAHRISLPIHAMAEAAGKVAEGDYAQRVDYSSPDEIGHLVERFNRMIQELARTTQELMDWAANLESKVEDRTSQVKAMQNQLLQAEKLAAIGKLAAGVAHEINNPLTGILTSGSLMLEDVPPDDPRHEELKIIVDETMRCRKIVKGLLDFARQTKPQKQAVSLNQVIADVVNLVGKQAAFRDIDIQMDLAADLPAVMADQDQMRQVVLNAVLNAAEAMHQGGELRFTSRHDSAGKTVEVSIADTGPGVPDDIKDKIFDPFFTTKKTGTGLGLAIAYGIVDRHGGTISIRSRPGHGTTVVFRIPVEAGGENEQLPQA